MKPYKILQVDHEAEHEVIEVAYKRLAAKYHPDKDPSPSATARMQEINAAYNILRDPARRRRYDLEQESLRSQPQPPREPEQREPEQREPEQREPEQREPEQRRAAREPQKPDLEEAAPETRSTLFPNTLWLAALIALVVYLAVSRWDSGQANAERERARSLSVMGTSHQQSEVFTKGAMQAVEDARTALAVKDYVGAVGSVGRALNLDPALSDNKQIASILFQTAQVKPTSDASFALLFGPMGAHGSDLVYDLAATEVVKLWVRARADTWLRSPDFGKVASPALSIAVALRFATNCPQRAALLVRAKTDGDVRVLGYLNQYKATTGCGSGPGYRDDCYACLRSDSRLADAIAAIHERNALKAPEPATLPGDEPGTIRSAGHDGKVYVRSPLTGAVDLVSPEDAADRVYSGGWLPVSQADGIRIDAQQILKDSSAF